MLSFHNGAGRELAVWWPDRNWVHPKFIILETEIPAFLPKTSALVRAVVSLCVVEERRMQILPT